MAKNNNLKDFLKNIADAIRESKDSTDLINPQEFADEIRSIRSNSSRWTGHADADGLREIGWTEDDIEYYQKHGVNWNEEDDEYHKVSDDNKALYGELTINNISTYKERIVYLPKIDISSKTSLYNVFNGCLALVAIPMLDTSKITSMGIMFYSCSSLVSVPQLDTQYVTDMNGMFNGCSSLVSVPQFNTKNVSIMQSMFNGCSSLVSVPQFNMDRASNINGMFNGCSSLVSLPSYDTSNAVDMNRFVQAARSLRLIRELDVKANTDTTQMFAQASSLEFLNLKNLNKDISLNNSALLSKESLLYIINNEAATEPITITLQSYAYARLAEDADIVAALKGKKITLGR